MPFAAVRRKFSLSPSFFSYKGRWKCYNDRIHLTLNRRFPISPLPPFNRPSGPHNQGGRPDSRRGEERVRTNQFIRCPQVRLILPDGSSPGILSSREAYARAQAMDLDLVEINPSANPPVCKIMDYGKFKYEEEQKRKAAKKNQTRQDVKEVKFHANVEDADYQLKIRNIRKFISDGNKVKLTLMYRGRENAHKELGTDVLSRVCADVADIAQVEQVPKIMGRSATGMLAPKSKKGQN